MRNRTLSALRPPFTLLGNDAYSRSDTLVLWDCPG